MLLEMLLARATQFHCDEFIATLLETLDNLTDQAALDAVGFDCDEGAFSGHFSERSKIG